MSVQLLDKTRKINKLLHNNHSSKVLFNDICEVMVETLDSNILVISKKGKVLGVGTCQGVQEITELIDDEVGGFIDKLLNERLLGVLSTKENVNLQTLGFESEGIDKYMAIISPIDIAGERLGTLFMYRDTKSYDIEDIIVSEYGTTVVGLEMMRSVHEENAEENLKAFREKVGEDVKVFPISAIIHEGVDQVLYAVADALETAPKFDMEEVEENTVVYNYEEEEAPFVVHNLGNGRWTITGKKIERLVSMTSLVSDDAIKRLSIKMRNMGIDEALRNAGCQDGDVVSILDFEFEFYD